MTALQRAHATEPGPRPRRVRFTLDDRVELLGRGVVPPCGFAEFRQVEAKARLLRLALHRFAQPRFGFVEAPQTHERQSVQALRLGVERAQSERRPELHERIAIATLLKRVDTA